MEGTRKEAGPLIVLDGASGVGKTTLFNSLTTGDHDFVPSTIQTIILKEMTNSHAKCKAQIWDINGQRRSYLNLNSPCYKLADAIVELFAIDNPFTLEHAINFRIPHLKKRFPKTPVLLVGTKADLRKMKKEEDLFPFELGPSVANCYGAVKYMECSSNMNFNVHEVIEEAVHSSLAKPPLDVFNKDLYGVMNVVACIYSKWAEVLLELDHPTNMLPDANSFLWQDLQLVELLTAIKHNLPTKMNFIYRALECDRLQLSYRLSRTGFEAYETSAPICTLWCIHNCHEVSPAQTVQCQTFSLTESNESLHCSSCRSNLCFFASHCKSVSRFLLSDKMRLVRSLVIVNCAGVLGFSFLTKLEGLEYLVILQTDVDLTTLTFPPHLQETMKHLVLNQCGIIQATNVPSEIGKLVNLQILNLGNNNFTKIPTTLGFLHKLHTLLIDQDKVCFPPSAVLKRSVRDVINYLDANHKNPVGNTESKLIVVGQEGVGKSTLVKAMKRSHWLTKNTPPPKTDGVDISELTLKDIQCKVYDLAGDVEYLNTHSLFLSPNTLHLVVYDLSRVIVDKGVRSADHLCRLELWLETIASRDPKSKVILVGTHADHPLLNERMLKKSRNLLVKVLIKYCSCHRSLNRSNLCEECFICNPEKCPETLECFGQLMESPDGGNSDVQSTTASKIPHILGYFEVSGIQKYPRSLSFFNVSVERVKSLAASAIANMMKATGTDLIPERWLSFRENIAQKLLSDDDLRQQPLMTLSRVRSIALELEIDMGEGMIAMLRFFHCQGTYLWCEDLPEMKDIVILDPQWLSDQLRTLISHRSSVDSICDGVLHLSELPSAWGEMSNDIRRILLTLFRSVGLCFSISDTEELFPCNLPVGWPDQEMWPPMPSRGENQTSLLFKFSFVPPSFFPDLTVEVHKNETFAKRVKPLYHRFNIVYITKDNSNGKRNTCLTEDDDACLSTHRVHIELMPYNNLLIVAVRGPDPPSIIPNIRSTIETVRNRRYPGITYSESMLCPKCVMRRVQPPASFEYDAPHDGLCPRGHTVGTNQAILEGKYSSDEIVLSETAQTGRVLGKTLQDHICPKLFVVLPINLDSGLSLKDRLVYSYLRDGFAVHLLCECPSHWHFVDSPGFRVGKPKEFFEKYGSRVCKALRFISSLSTPIKAAAALDPHCKAAAAVGTGAKSASQELESLLDSYLDKYPHLKPTLGSSKDDLKELKSSSGLQRSELSRFLEVEVKGRNFGPLVCTYVDKRDEWLWLCEEHNERFEMVTRENENL